VSFLLQRSIKIYSLRIKDIDNIYIEEITSWNSFQYFWELNRAGGCNISFNIDDPKFTQNNLFPARHFIDIFRGDRKLWSGVLSGVSGNVGDISGRLTLTFSGYLALLEKMEVNPSGKIFTDIEQGTILWTLIDDFQGLPNGNYGITQGSVTTGIKRDREYSPFKNVYEAFIQMTEVINGCDLEITQNKVLNVYAHQGRRLEAIVFEYGKNITGLNFNFSMKDLVNQANAIGSGEGIDLLYSVAHNMQSQEIYGLMQESFSHSDVKELNTLAEHAKKYVEEYPNPTQIYGCDVRDTIDTVLKSYSVGDEVRLRIKKGYLDIDTYRRIKKLSISVDQNEKESIGVSFQ